MLFHDRSRTASKQPYSITPPSQTGGLTTGTPLGLEPVTNANMNAFMPGEAQNALVPSSVNPNMMPGAQTNLPMTQPLRTPVLIAATGKKYKDNACSSGETGCSKYWDGCRFGGNRAWNFNCRHSRGKWAGKYASENI